MNLKNQAINYFKIFCLKDLNGLENIFDKKISLNDWVVEIKGVKNVIKFNKKTFNKFKKINVKIKEIFSNNKKRSVACKIIIKLDKIELKVVDILYFSKKNKIVRIEAYKL